MPMNENRKTVGILTTTRAEYGILNPLIRKMCEDSFFDVKVLVTGTHLCEKYGKTVEEIETDGIPIAARIEILSGDDTPIGVSRTMANAIERFAAYFSDNSFDAVIVLGDRYETLAVCIAAMNERIPIIHLHGGETTEGAVDECIRHSITKMSQLHLTAAEEYRKRVIQLGESPDRVFNIGSIGVENVLQKELLSFDDLKESLKGINPDFKEEAFGKPYAVVTFHPVTLEENSALTQINELLKALDENSELSYIFTLANADNGGQLINERVLEYAGRKNNVNVFASLGALRYLSAVKHSQMVIGNSSSGIIEVPSFKVATVNIGDRQKGRISAESVINCEANSRDISAAIRKAQSDEFTEKCRLAENPYYKSNSSENAVKIIRDYLSREKDLKKSFYDIKNI